jgi:predicted signal transduction protein with EAL and GGDEF domain
VGGLFISLLASSGLAFIAATEVRGPAPYGWWAAMLAVLATRGLDQWHFRRTRSSTRLRGVARIRRFGVGLLSTGILWAAFPLMFFTLMDQTGRAYTAIVVSGMVGGSATVLAPSRRLSFFYCACLLLPASVLFIVLGGTENTVLGVLGCVFFAVMVLSSTLTHKAIMSAIILSRRNEALAVEMLEQRQLTENANIELKTAQLELSKINQSLESRIEARTADLAREIREKNQYAKDLAYLASTDSLTGIFNRASILKRLGDALARAQLSEGLLGVLFLDLNKFKEVKMTRWVIMRVTVCCARLPSVFPLFCRLKHAWHGGAETSLWSYCRI